MGVAGRVSNNENGRHSRYMARYLVQSRKGIRKRARERVHAGPLGKGVRAEGVASGRCRGERGFTQRVFAQRAFARIIMFAKGLREGVGSCWHRVSLAEHVRRRTGKGCLASRRGCACMLAMMHRKSVVVNRCVLAMMRRQWMRTRVSSSMDIWKGCRSFRSDPNIIIA